MKTRNILILCTAFLVSMPSAEAQSFKDGLKSLGDKIGKQIVKTTQSVKSQTTDSKPTSDNRLHETIREHAHIFSGVVQIVIRQFSYMQRPVVLQGGQLICLAVVIEITLPLAE